MKHLNKLCLAIIILVALATARECYQHRDSIAASRAAYRAQADAYYASRPTTTVPPSRAEAALLTLMGRMPEAKAEQVEAKSSQRLSFKEQLKKTARGYAIPTPLVLATLSKEDAPWCKGTFCIKYEESYWNRCGHHKNNEMRRMCASSICQMQVMGKNAEALGHRPTDLFDEAVCVEVGVKMLADCWHKNEGIRTTKARVIATGQCYNGARSYGEDLWPRVVRQAEGIDIS